MLGGRVCVTGTSHKYTTPLSGGRCVDTVVRSCFYICQLHMGQPQLASTLANSPPHNTMPPTHLRFDDSDEDNAAPPSTHGAIHHTTHLHCISTVRTDFNSNDRCYVLQLAFAPGSSTDVAAACSNNLVKLYSINESQVVHIRDCIGHTSTLTSLTFIQPHVLATSSYDGTVRTWDARNGQQVAKYVLGYCGMLLGVVVMWSAFTPINNPFCRFAAGHHALFSCSAGGDHHIAAGADGKVLFWDARSTKQLVAFADTHAGEVTQVCGGGMLTHAQRMQHTQHTWLHAHNHPGTLPPIPSQFPCQWIGRRADCGTRCLHRPP